MRWLIWYFRSLFCGHDWKYEEAAFIHTHRRYVGDTERLINPDADRMAKELAAEEYVTIVSATCMKCGWHRSYKKF